MKIQFTDIWLILSPNETLIIVWYCIESYICPFWSFITCHLFGAKPLPEPMMTESQFDPLEQTSLKLLQDGGAQAWMLLQKSLLHEAMIFIQENAFENVSNTVGHCVPASMC